MFKMGSNLLILLVGCVVIIDFDFFIVSLGSL